MRRGSEAVNKLWSTKAHRSEREGTARWAPLQQKVRQKASLTRRDHHVRGQSKTQGWQGDEVAF